MSNTIVYPVFNKAPGTYASLRKKLKRVFPEVEYFRDTQSITVVRAALDNQGAPVLEQFRLNNRYSRVALYSVEVGDWNELLRCLTDNLFANDDNFMCHTCHRGGTIKSRGSAYSVSDCQKCHHVYYWERKA